MHIRAFALHKNSIVATSAAAFGFGCYTDTVEIKKRILQSP